MSKRRNEGIKNVKSGHVKKWKTQKTKKIKKLKAGKTQKNNNKSTLKMENSKKTSQTPMKNKKIAAPTSTTNEQKQKKSLTHQTLFVKANRHRAQKPNISIKPAYDFNLSKSRNQLSLRERMLQKLKAARFRYLNEQMYTNMGKDAKQYFENDPNAYNAYHEGYQQQVAKWPINPVDIVISKVKKLPQDYVIADFGCGEAKLAKSITHNVHCFDLVALNERVTSCDMSHVPLKNNSVNVVVFCLSLMGTNLREYILEAKRVLKNKGLLMIAEVESRFDNVEIFIKNMKSYGFVNTTKDCSHNLFFFLDFVMQDVKIPSSLPDISLKPCLYKKR